MAKIRFQTIDNQEKKNKIRFQLIDEPQKNKDNTPFDPLQNIKNNIATAQQLVQQREAEQAQKDAESKRIVSLPFKSNSILAIDKDKEKMQKDADIILKNNKKLNALVNEKNLKNKKGEALPTLKYNEAAEPLTFEEELAFKLKEGLPVANEIAGVGWNVTKAIGELGDDLLDIGLELGTSDWNPMYLTGLYDKKAQQDIAKELAQVDAAQNAVEAYGLKGAQDYVNENSALFNENSLGGTVVREATKILLESQLAPSIPGATAGTKLLSKAGLKQFGRSAAGIAGTMGIVAYGNALEQAYNNGATREQASKYALMSSALEVATEMMFAGLGGFKGKGALDDVVQSKIASKYGNKLKGKILSKVSDVLGEETEELVSWGIDPLLQKITYAADQELGDLYDVDELGDTFAQTGLTVLLLGCLPSDAEDSRKKIREQYVDYYMNSHEGATKKEANEALKRAEKEAEKVAKQVEKQSKQQKGLFKNINEEISGKGSVGNGLSLEEIIKNVDPEAAKKIDEMKEQKAEKTTEKVEEQKPTEESKAKTSLTELVEEPTPKTEQQEVEEPKKDFNTQIKDIAKQYGVNATTLKNAGVTDINEAENVAKAMAKRDYNAKVKELSKEYGVGVSVLKSTKITDLKKLENVAKTLSTKDETKVEKTKELPKKETKTVKVEKPKTTETKVAKVEEKLPKATEATEEDINHLFNKTPHMTEGEKQTKAQNKNQLYESAKYFNEKASTSGAKFNIKNSDIQKALDNYVQYKEAGGKKTIENLERLRKPSIVEKAKENAKTLPKKEQLVSKKDFADKLTALMDVQKAMDEDSGKPTTKLPKLETKKVEKTESVKNTQTKKTTKVAKTEETKTTKILPKTEEQIDAEIKELAQKGVTTTKADVKTTQMFMESKAKKLERQLSDLRLRNNKSETEAYITNTINQYDKLLADGGKKIPEFEEFKAKHQPKVEAEKVIKDLGEKVTIAAASNRSNVKVIKDIDKALNKKSKNIDKPLNIADVAESLTSNTYSDDIADTPKNSEILTEFKKLSNKKSQVDEDIITQAKAWLVNKQAAIEKMDRQNRNYEGEQALARYKVSPGEGAVQVTNAQTDLDGNVVGKSIVQMEQEYYNGLSPEAKQIFGYWINLKRDVGFRENSAELSEDIDSEYANNIFAEYSIEQEKQMIDALEKAYPGLANHIETMFKDLRTYYRNENANLVKSGILSKTRDVPVKYAKNRMGMTDEQIAANRNKDGSVKVNTIDYLAAMNPYYFHVVRDVDKRSGNTATTKTSVSVKGPQGLKEGAERYAIQPLFDGMADGAVKNREAMSLNQLLATIARNDKSFENNQIPPTDVFEKDENGNEKKVIRMGDDYYIKYRDNGKYRAAKINKSMYDAISNNMTFVDKLFNVKVLKQYKGLNNIEKRLLTTLNPDFLMKNTARDLGEALLNTNYSDTVFVPEYIKSIWDIASNNEQWQLFINSGLYQSDGYFQYSKKDGITKRNPVTKNTIGKMEDIAAISEALPRFTEFKLALKKGESLNEAIRQAKRVTVDFGRRGKAFETTDRNFSKFVGAAEAGMNTMYDNIIGNNIYSAQTIMRKLHGEELTSRDIQTLKKSGMTMARIVLSSMLPSIYNSLAFGGDDDKEWLENNVPEYIRNNAYIIRIGKNTYIPLYYARSQSVYKKAFDEMLNKDSLGDKINNITESFKENIAPNNPFETSTLNNVSNWFQNKDYYGNKIY